MTFSPLADFLQGFVRGSELPVVYDEAAVKLHHVQKLLVQRMKIDETKMFK